MRYKVIVRPEAENDLKEAFSWYESKRIGLGYDFLLQVDAGINLIKRNPEMHSSEYKGTKKHLIKRFPYKIIYLVENENIIIIAILHNKRRPKLIELEKTYNQSLQRTVHPCRFPHTLQPSRAICRLSSNVMFTK
jgi:toxin ParE1/3/4